MNKKNKGRTKPIARRLKSGVNRNKPVRINAFENELKWLDKDKRYRNSEQVYLIVELPKGVYKYSQENEVEWNRVIQSGLLSAMEALDPDSIKEIKCRIQVGTAAASGQS
ncbi:hypothetical protein ACM1RC_08370 [Paenibacillus azoreducens]|uniref:hypothetical protein n=1 Tax=Paenibacillus azoreducens TaxID=116718 RepID=UPI0039F5BCA2